MRDRVNKVIIAELGCPPGEVVYEATFQALGADSLDMVMLTMAFDDEFHVDISDEDAERCVTVGDAYVLIERLTNA